MRLELPQEALAHIAATQTVLGPTLLAASKLDAASARVLGLEGGAMLAVILLLLLSCGGVEAWSAIWPVIDRGFAAAWPGPIVSAVAGIAAALGVALVAFLLHRGVRRRVARTLAARPPSTGAPHGVCHGCGGPLPPLDPAGRLSVRCHYCGCDNFHGGDVVARTAVDLEASLTSHARDMLRAMRRIKLATALIGFAILVMIPGVSLTVWLSVARLLERH